MVGTRVLHGEAGLPGIAILSRAPVAGEVKSRLAATLGAETAAQVHRALALDTIESALAWAGACRAPDVVLALTGPPAACASFAAEAARIGRLRVRAQVPGDLGARMAAALDARLAEGCASAVVVGTDLPDLRRALDATAEALAGGALAAAVPALDGGFVALGVTRPAGGMLDGLPWGTGEALGATARAFEAAGIELVRAGEAEDDVDDEAALARLRERLREGRIRAPHSAAWLAPGRAGAARGGPSGRLSRAGEGPEKVR